MTNVLIFLFGAGLMFYMALRSVLARLRLCTQGETVRAVVAGTVQSREGISYILEFTTAGGSHRLQYPCPTKSKGFAVGSTVTLHYDSDHPEKLYVEGDKAVLGAEILYFVLGAALLLLSFGML